MEQATSADQGYTSKLQLNGARVALICFAVLAMALVARHYLGSKVEPDSVQSASTPVLLGQHQVPADDDMRQRELEAFVAVGESPATPTATAGAAIEARYDQALLKETDAFMAATDSVLQHVNDPNWTAVAREHSLWGIDLYKRAEVFTGSGSAADRMSSPFRVCHEAVYFAKERWLARLSYASRPTRDNYATVQRVDGTYMQRRAECTKAGAKA